MTKKTYTTPEVEQIQCSVESGIAASVVSIWNDAAASSDDFSLIVEDDNTFGN